MSTTTTTILIGHPHQNQGGVSATHLLELIEGSRTVWRLTELCGSDGPLVPTVVRWVTDRDHFLDDVRVLIALHVVRDPDVRVLAARLDSLLLEDDVDPTELLAADRRDELSQVAGALLEAGAPALVVTVMEAGGVPEWLRPLATWPGDVVITTPAWSRFHNAWAGEHGETVVEGSLE